MAADGGLASGKRAIAVDAAGTQFVTPIAESCRSCHAEGKTYGVDVLHVGGAH